MSAIVKNATNALKEAILSAMKKAVEDGSLPPAEQFPEVVLEVPADKLHGDWSSNAAMASARTFRMAPAKIAKAILEHLDLSGTYFCKAETAGPGFLNFFLSPRILPGRSEGRDCKGR